MILKLLRIDSVILEQCKEYIRKVFRKLLFRYVVVQVSQIKKFRAEHLKSQVFEKSLIKSDCSLKTSKIILIKLIKITNYFQLIFNNTVSFKQFGL